MFCKLETVQLSFQGMNLELLFWTDQISAEAETLGTTEDDNNGKDVHFNSGTFISYYDHVWEWHNQNLRIHTQSTTDLRITYDNQNYSI